MGGFFERIAFVYSNIVLSGILNKIIYGKKIRILSIGGGGIKGILPGIILEYIENLIKSRMEPTGGFRITSTLLQVQAREGY